MDQRPKVGVGVHIYNNTGQILMGKRRNAHGEGDWCPPGGHLDYGETPADCAAREVLEETGLIVSDIRPLGFTNDIFTDENKHYITLHMQALWCSGLPQVMEPDKCEYWKWFDMDNLPQPLFLPVRNFFQS